VCDDVCEAARTPKVTTTASVGFGRDSGVAAGNVAEPGSTPWVAASSAPAVSSRVCMRGSEAPGHGEAAAVRPS
jgi:hypothetical protein